MKDAAHIHTFACEWFPWIPRCRRGGHLPRGGTGAGVWPTRFQLVNHDASGKDRKERGNERVVRKGHGPVPYLGSFPPL